MHLRCHAPIIVGQKGDKVSINTWNLTCSHLICLKDNWLLLLMIVWQLVCWNISTSGGDCSCNSGRAAGGCERLAVWQTDPLQNPKVDITRLVVFVSGHHVYAGFSNPKGKFSVSFSNGWDQTRHYMLMPESVFCIHLQYFTAPSEPMLCSLLLSSVAASSSIPARYCLSHCKQCLH